MARYTDTLTDYRTLRPLGGAEVYVYQDDLTQEGGDLVTLLDDDGLALSNPLTTGTDGTFYFNVPDGFYVLKYVYRGHPIGTSYRVGVGAATIGLPPVGSDGQFLGAGGTPASAAWQNIDWTDITGSPTSNAALAPLLGGGGGSVTGGVSISSYLTTPRTPFVTDDLAAFNACRDAILAQTQGAFAGNRVMLLPAGRYYLSGRFDTKGIRVVGEHSGQPGGAGTLIRLGKNVSGIRLTNGTNDAASTLEGVQIWGGNVNVNSDGSVATFAAADSTTGNGVEIACNWAACIDVSVAFMGGNGFSANSSVALCDCFYFERCQSQFNRGDGYIANGSDANAGTFMNCSAISNGGAGFRDYSFLGNTYVQCHARDNGVLDSTASNGPVGTCKYGSGPTYYYVVAGREAQASTEVPGSVSNGTEAWRTFSGHPSCKLWTTGQTWVSAGPYITNSANTNGRNVFNGCYAESAQPPVQAFSPSLFVGGLIDEVGLDPSSTATWLRGALDGSLVIPGISTWAPGVATNVVGGTSLPVTSVNRAWDATTPGLNQGSVHLNHSTVNGSGPALTFGFAGNAGLKAGAGIYSVSSSAYGTRLYFGTTDDFAAGAKAAFSVDEFGGVSFSRRGIIPNVQAVTSAATVTPVFGNDLVKVTAQAVALTIANPSGTAIPGAGFVIRIKDNGTARAISFGTQYRALGVTLPTTTVVSKTLYIGCVYNSDDGKVDVLSVAQEA